MLMSAYYMVHYG